jgi:hypothetical protein
LKTCRFQGIPERPWPARDSSKYLENHHVSKLFLSSEGQPGMLGNTLKTITFQSYSAARGAGWELPEYL